MANLAHDLQQELGKSGLKRPFSHPSRSLHRVVERAGLRWKVPISYHQFHKGDGEILPLPYLAPKDLVQYLLEHCPEVFWGGLRDPQEAAKSLKSFWIAYKQQHPEHVVFQQADGESSLEYSIPVAVYGDEGRGVRRGQTALFALEAILGFHSAKNMREGKTSCFCQSCEVSEPIRKRFCNSLREAPEHSEAFAFQTTCNTEHSFLSRFCLWLLPCSIYKPYPLALDELLTVVAQGLRELFYEGVLAHGRCWTITLIGSKGDMRWFDRIAYLNRTWSTKGRKRDLGMCAECHAGLPGMPYEDVSEHPSWETTCFASRPWSEEWVEPPLSRVPFESGDSARPEMLYRRDVFHIGKQGVLRHFTASVLVTLFSLGYFSVGAGDGQAADVKLLRAHGHFSLWCTAVGKNPSLRSFSKSLLNWKSWKHFPWFNVKGSDATLLLRWMYTLLTELIMTAERPANHGLLSTMRATAQAGDDFYRLMYAHNLWLAPKCAAQLVQYSTAFLNGYVLLAQHAFDQRLTTFAMVPKIHAYRHLILDLERALEAQHTAVINPLAWNNELGEDLVGRVCRLARRVDVRLQMRRTLILFLVKARAVHLRARAKLCK